MKQLDSLSYIGEKSYITIILTDGTTFTNYSKDEFNPLHFRDSSWFLHLNEIAGLQSYWIDAEPTVFPYDRTDSQYQLSVARTLRLDSSDIYGHVIVTLLENKISSIFNSVQNVQDMMLINEQGQIISSIYVDRILQEYQYRDHLHLHDKPQSLIIREGSEKILLTTTPLPFNEWHIVSEQSYEHAILNISSIFQRVFIFQVISFVVFLIILLLLMRTFTKPLIKLSKVASTVQRGNLSVRTNVRGNDEIGRLGYLFDQMLDRIKEMLTEVSLTQKRKRQAELAMLQAQINPHFLFNVLNSIRMKVKRGGDQESARMIASLSRLLRMTISREEDTITLHEEIELIAHYVDLMNLRQKEETKLIIEVDKEVFHTQVPRFILQPLVENALIHGLHDSLGVICIRAQMKNQYIELSVEDNGVGMEEKQVSLIEARLLNMYSQLDNSISTVDKSGHEQGRAGIGIVNVAERLTMMFGEQFYMRLMSTPNKGTTIIMYIPIREENKEHV